MSTTALDDIWSAIFELAKSDGVVPLKALPGCWYRRLDERWEIGVNGHREARSCTFADGPSRVPPFSICVVFNGWPAGIIDPHGGSIAAGALANIDTFVEALRGVLTP